METKIKVSFESICEKCKTIGDIQEIFKQVKGGIK